MVTEIKEVLEKNNSHGSLIDENSHVRQVGIVPKFKHSCSPNCGIKVNETGAHDFVARQDIAIGEEIIFDYVIRNYSIEHLHEQCQCGAIKC